tara:strand:+ start:68 stop:766 length:699 start_codon:yes stop_codon:yes gene_type:complete
MMKKLIFNTAKEAFRRGFKKYKKGKRQTERVPYDLVKADIKRKIRGTRFYVGAEAKARPGIGSKGLPKGGRPRIFGKAYASDKRGKSMQIPMMTKKQRAANQEAISQSVRKFMKERIGKKKLGGLNTIKMVKSKLEKASAAHAGQAKALGKIIPKKLLGGLLTTGIKTAAKKYFKTGNKTQQIVNKFGGGRKFAKSDVKSGIRSEVLRTLKNKNLTVEQRRKIIRDINKLNR